MIASGGTRQERSWKRSKALSAGSPDKIDYASLVRYSDLQPADEISIKSVLAVAAFFGSTRLIDNMIIDEREGKLTCVY